MPLRLPVISCASSVTRAVLVLAGQLISGAVLSSARTVPQQVLKPAFTTPGRRRTSYTNSPQPSMTGPLAGLASMTVISKSAFVRQPNWPNKTFVACNVYWQLLPSVTFAMLRQDGFVGCTVVWLATMLKLRFVVFPAPSVAIICTV